MHNVIQEVINMDKYILPVDYKPQSYEKVLFTGSHEECVEYKKNNTRFYN